MDTTTQIPIPTNPDMAEEPALTIGELFRDKAQLNAAIVASVVIIAMFGINVPADLSDKLTNALNVLVPLIAVIYGGFAAKKQAVTQAEATRKRVYAPATVADLVDTASTTDLEERVRHV